MFMKKGDSVAQVLCAVTVDQRQPAQVCSALSNAEVSRELALQGGAGCREERTLTSAFALYATLSPP
jgi:hypothetical protein